MLKLFLKKSISASNFGFTIFFILKTIKKQPSISAIKLMDPNNFRYNFGNYEKLFRHFGFGNDHLLREAISANIYSFNQCNNNPITYILTLTIKNVLIINLFTEISLQITFSNLFLSKIVNDIN